MHGKNICSLSALAPKKGGPAWRMPHPARDGFHAQQQATGPAAGVVRRGAARPGTVLLIYCAGTKGWAPHRSGKYTWYQMRKDSTVYSFRWVFSWPE